MSGALCAYNLLNMDRANRLIVALDRSTRDEILALADALQGVAGTYKIGLQAFVANGPEIVRELVSRDCRVFLDLKLHDIPNTVSRAVGEARKLGVSMLTIHAAGGRPMMSAAVKEVSHGAPMLLAVTVLTSLGESDILEIGMGGSPEKAAVRLALLARGCGIDGVVASPLEIRSIRDACGKALAIVTPGIRGEGEAAGDQTRTMTAREAIEAGADYLVVGRPIAAAPDPRAAALRILESIR